MKTGSTAKVIPLCPRGPFTKEAKLRWDRIPEWAQTRILDNVFCAQCLKSVTIALQSAKMQKQDLILRGKCKICGHEVCRLVEPENE